MGGAWGGGRFSYSRIHRWLVALGLYFMAAAWTPTARAQPNIVFIMADDMGWADVSTPLTTMGDPSDFYETPTLEALASAGMAFTNAYANPTCAPTRTAILSGAYAPRPSNNVYVVGDWSTTSLLAGAPQGTNGSNGNLATSTVTHAETLQSAGYATATVGKFHVASNVNQITSSHGFDENYGGSTSGGPGAYHATGGAFGNSISASLDAYAADYTQTYVDANIKPYANGTSLSEIDALVGTAKHVTDAQADAAIDFINNHSAGPFYVQYSAYAVHTPVATTEARADLLDKYQGKTPGTGNSNAAYGALVEGLDQSVARIVDHLQSTPDPRNPGQMLDENTLVVFYSDNGGLSRYADLSELDGAKGSLNEGGIRVPMIAWSGNANLVEANTINDTVVMPVDFYKTFAGLAGATLPAGQVLDGEDLSGIFADADADLGRENVYWHLPGSLGGVGGGGEQPRTVTRSGDWKLIYNYEDQSFELYDLSTDLSETTNLADDNPSVIADLGGDILAWLDETDAPLAALRTGTLDLLIDGLAYAGGAVTAYDNQLVTILAGQEVPYILPEPATIPGDLDGDGFVGIADLNLVLTNWNQNVPPGNPLADTNDDGFIGIIDLNEVLGNWNGGIPPVNSTTAIPEPSMWVIMGLCGFSIARRRHVNHR